MGNASELLRIARNGLKIASNDVQAFAVVRTIMAVDQEAAVAGKADEAELNREDDLGRGRRGAGCLLGRYHGRGAKAYAR